MKLVALSVEKEAVGAKSVDCILSYGTITFTVIIVDGPENRSSSSYR